MNIRSYSNNFMIKSSILKLIIFSGLLFLSDNLLAQSFKVKGVQIGGIEKEISGEFIFTDSSVWISRIISNDTNITTLIISEKKDEKIICKMGSITYEYEIYKSSKKEERKSNIFYIKEIVINQAGRIIFTYKTLLI